ncbi:MAG: hypothetical protein CL610_13890 [Anaerolineaceae bacterium]|nr:hypothetical protein [Anaerolineaceae bacterium]
MSIEYGDSSIHLWPVGAGILIVMLLIMWRRKHSLAYVLCGGIFGVYVLFTLDKTLFPIRIMDEMLHSGEPMRLWSLNLIPFNFDMTFIPHMVVRQIVLNILLTVPFGFGINFVAHVRAKHILWLALAVGLSIETLQLMIGFLLRYLYRVVDVNDVLLNATGVLIGYGTFQVCARLYTRITRKPDRNQNGLVAFLYDVANRA